MSAPDDEDIELGLVPSDDSAPDAPNWKRGLDYSDKGPRATIGNAIHALTLSLEWRDVLAFNEFDGSVVKLREPPMRDTERPRDYQLGEWTDIDTTLATAWLARNAEVRVSPQIMGRAVYAVAQQKKFHPIREYLERQLWDGVQRLPSWLSRCMGAEDTLYTQAIGKLWAIGAVARVFKPGCKMDTALVLEGKQGIGKSTALQILAGANFYSDTPIVFGEKDSYEALRGVWIYELAELSALRRSDVEAQKAFLSKLVDRYRRPYAEATTAWPRQVVFAGTTNDERYLADPTGNRRFWPVRCGKIDFSLLRAERDQLWAEAVVRFKENEPWHITSDDVAEAAASIQAERVFADDWLVIVGRWLKTERAQYVINQGHGLSTADVLADALGVTKEKLDRAATTRVGILLRSLGWGRRRIVTMPTGEREWRLFEGDQG